MPITFTCPHCGATTSVADPFAGRSGPCATCGKAITIPGPAGYEPPPKKSLLPIILAICGGVLVVLFVCGGVLAGLLLPAINAARNAARQSMSKNNLKQIGTAMALYENDHGHFPPAYVTDDSGKPLLSWRVLLLPYLGHDDLYKKFDLKQAWDSPRNRDASAQVVAEYRNPSDSARPVSDLTNYVVVVGDETIFPPGKDGLANVPDGATFTLLVAETDASDIHWAEPRDLRFDKMSMTINDPRGNAISGPWPQGPAVLMADTHVQNLAKDLKPATVRALLTANGGEKINPGEVLP